MCDPSTVGSDPLLATLLDHVAAQGEWRAPEERLAVGDSREHETDGRRNVIANRPKYI